MTAQTQTKTPDLGTLEQRREEVIRSLERWKTVLQEVNAVLARAMALGDADSEEAEDARHRRAEARDRLQELEDALPVLDHMIRDMTREGHQQALNERLAAAQSLIEESANRDRALGEEIDDLRTRLQEKEEERGRGRSTIIHLIEEITALCDLARRPVPDLPTVPDLDHRPNRLLPPIKRLRSAVRDLKQVGHESPSMALIPGFEEMSKAEWREVLDRENRGRIQEQDEERQQARDEIDGWLVSVLEQGPMPQREVVRQATARGWSTSQGAYEVHLAAARRRTGVVALSRTGDEDSTPYWGLPAFDALEYEPARSSSRMPAHLLQTAW